MKASFVLLVLIAVLLSGGFVFLSAWDIPAPSRQVEKVIPNARF